MLTAKDLTKISAVVESRLELFRDEFYEQFYTKAELDVKFSQVLTAIDGIAKSHLAFQQEMASINHRVENTESWIDKAAPTIGIQFEH